MTLLEEYATALRRLLHGQTVSMSGRYVTLDAVGLTWPPETAPPVLVGAVGPRTLTLAGAVGDGVILTGGTTVEQVREAVRQVADSTLQVVVFLPVADKPSAAEVADQVGRFAEAGATTVALLSVGDDAPPLAEFARFAGREVQPLLG